MWPRDHAADVGALDHLGQQVLVVQLDDLGRAHHRHRDRRVVHREHGAVLGRRRELVGQPGQLGRRDLPVVVAGDARVEGDHPEAGDVVHPVLGDVLGDLLAEQLARIGLALVVVAHHPDDLGPDLGGRRLDDLAQLHVGLRLGAVGQVAGEHDGLWRELEAGQPGHRVAQVLVGVDGAVQPTFGQQVRVADVGDDVGGERVLTQRDHGTSVGGRRDAHRHSHIVSRGCGNRHLERQLPAQPDRPRRGAPATPRHRRARRAGDQGARGPAAADGAHRARLRRRVGRVRPVERRRDHQPGRHRGRAGRVPGDADVGRPCGGGGPGDRGDLWRRTPVVAVRPQRPQGRRPPLRLQARVAGPTARGGPVDDRRRRPRRRLEHRAAGRGRLRHGGLREGHPRHPAGAGRVRRASSRTGTSTSYARTRLAPTSSPTGTTTASATSGTAACASTSSSATPRSPPA